MKNTIKDFDLDLKTTKNRAIIRSESDKNSECNAKL